MNEAAYQQASKLLNIILTEGRYEDRQTLVNRLMCPARESPAEDVRWAHIYFKPNKFDQLREALSGEDKDLSARLADDAHARGAYDIAVAAAPYSGHSEKIPFIIDEWNKKLFDNYGGKQEPTAKERFGKEVESHARALIHYAKKEPYASSPTLQKHLNNTYALSLGFSSKACRDLSFLEFTLDERNRKIIGTKIEELKAGLDSKDNARRQNAYANIGRIASILPDEQYARSIIKDAIDHSYAHEGADWTSKISTILQAYQEKSYPRARHSNSPEPSTPPSSPSEPKPDAPSIVLE